MRRVRVLNGMEAVLGPRHWKRFVEYAKRTHYRQFLARFRRADHYLICDGGGESRPCPVRFKVGTATEEGLHELRWLHLDHNTDLKLVCEKWRTTHDPKSKRWSGAFKKRHLVSFLFEDLQFRCHLPTMQPRERCHRTDLPHYRIGKKCQFRFVLTGVSSVRLQSEVLKVCKLVNVRERTNVVLTDNRQVQARGAQVAAGGRRSQLSSKG